MLQITDITLRNFRSYHEFALHEVGELTIFVGPNASGKTNIVEAIQLLTALSSFRNATAAELVSNGESQARIAASMTDGGRLLDIALQLETEPGSRHYMLNGKNKQAKAIRGTLPSVAFTPDDLNLVKGSDRFRRRELDVLGAQLNANYFQLIRDYEKVLRQKNKLLKDEAPLPLVEAANEVFAKVGEQLTSYREALFNRLAPRISSHYAGISGSREELTAEYVRSSKCAKGTGPLAHPTPLSQAIDLAAEQRRGRALAGPHLDKVNFYIDGLDAQSFASQGQQRSIVLACKLAEAEGVEEILGQLPVLLLDDVMSELDATRREALVQGLLTGKQTFITTANIDYFDSDMLERANVIELG